jgi:hypothetical protein
MDNTELLQALSNININSETAVEVVEIYCQYKLYQSVIECASMLAFIGIIAAFGWFVISLIKAVDD